MTSLRNQVTSKNTTTHTHEHGTHTSLREEHQITHKHKEDRGYDQNLSQFLAEQHECRLSCIKRPLWV